MKQLAVIIIAGLLLAPHARAECNYAVKYQSPDSSSRNYALAELRSFVVSEIRPRASREETRGQVVISRTCPNSTSAIEFHVRTDNYALASVNGIEVDEAVYKFDEQNIEISKARFDYYFSAAEKFSQAAKRSQLEILKFFSYLFTASARFESIEERLDDLFLRNCRVNWSESKWLFRRWGRLSAFAAAAEGQERNDSAGNGREYSTISRAVLSAYLKTANEGIHTPLARYIDPNDFGQGITLDTPSCSSHQLTRQEERDEILLLLAFTLVLNNWQTAQTKPRQGHNIGAVLADQNGFPVFWARNANIALDDASQHGEVRLIQNYLKCAGIGAYAQGLTVYSTLEPCAMCSGMMTLTQVDRVVYGQDDPDYGDTAAALLAINYPDVYEDAPLDVSEIKRELDAAYKMANATGRMGITSFLLSEQARRLFETARKKLVAYQVSYSENRPVLNAALKLAQYAGAEDPSKGLGANCPIKSNPEGVSP